ncbi:MAG: hypothetical protein ACI837_002533 [Crocinitomicaceae bacterium]|jgi:hypothetical protein
MAWFVILRTNIIAMKTITIIGIIASLLLTSCAMRNGELTGVTGWEHNSGGNDFATENDISQRTAPKIIKAATLHLTVKNPDTANVLIAKIAAKYEGYVQETGTTMSIIRIQANYLDSAMIMTEGLGTIMRKYVSGKDVTEEYADFEIRLNNAELARKRYLELLAKAENVEAALKVEKELERLNGTIEMMKGRMNRMDHLVQYSTITFYLKEKKKPGVLGYIGVGLWKAVRWLFVRN